MLAGLFWFAALWLKSAWDNGTQVMGRKMVEKENSERLSDAVGQCERDSELWAVADEFRAWVVRDLQAVAAEERQSYRGDYLFLVDDRPCFLVIVTTEGVSTGRILVQENHYQATFDLGMAFELPSETLRSMLDTGAVRVQVSTDAATLRRLLAGTLRAKIAYLNGMVKISGDLPCFMRLVSLLKGRGVGPRKASSLGSSEAPVPLPTR